MIPEEELEGKTLEEKDEVINQYVQEDFEQKISYAVIDIEY